MFLQHPSYYFCIIFILTIISCLSTNAAVQSNDITKIPCTINDASCIVSGIFETKDDDAKVFFKLTTERPAAITSVIIKASRIPTWNYSAICSDFPNLEKLSISRIGIKAIDPHTFDACTKLKYLDLSYNEIRKIELKTFQNLNALDTLYLYNNNLTYFSADIVKGLKKLTKLALISNQIFDIDEDKFKVNCESLSDFWFNDNNLRCDRISTIKSKLRAVNVKPFTYIAQIRSREEETRKVDDMICLSSAQWVASILENHQNGNDDKDFESLKKSFEEAKMALQEKIYSAEDKLNNINQQISASVLPKLTEVDELEMRLQEMEANTNSSLVENQMANVYSQLAELTKNFEEFKDESSNNFTNPEFEERLQVLEESVKSYLNSTESASAAEIRLQESSSGISWILIFILILVNVGFFAAGIFVAKMLVKNEVLLYFEGKERVMSRLSISEG